MLIILKFDIHGTQTTITEAVMILNEAKKVYKKYEIVILIVAHNIPFNILSQLKQINKYWLLVALSRWSTLGSH